MYQYYTDGKNPDFISLCHQLDCYLNNIVNGEKNRAHYIPYNQLDDIHRVIPLQDGNTPVGCASIKEYNTTCAELKRVFLLPSYRGKGWGKFLLQKIEALAKANGYTCMLLESGELLTSAMHLYRSNGYLEIENYGPYQNDTEAVCMKKTL